MAWKYKLRIGGSSKELDDFARELQRLGHTGSTVFFFKPNRKRWLYTNWINGKYSVYSDELGVVDASLQLPQDHDLALALATQQEGNEIHEGEYAVEYTGLLYRRHGLNYYEVGGDRVVGTKLFGGSKATLEELRNYFLIRPQYSALHERSLTSDQRYSQHRNGEPTSEKRKIIGYKSPFDLYRGEIPAGTVYKPLSFSRPTVYGAVDGNGKPLDSGKHNMPAEIVEKWEPVYEEREVRLQRNGYNIIISKKGIQVSHSEGVKKCWVKVEDLRQTLGYYSRLYHWDRVNDHGSKEGLHEWMITADTFTIGCTSGFKRTDIEEAIKIFDDMGGQEV